MSGGLLADRQAAVDQSLACRRRLAAVLVGIVLFFNCSAGTVFALAGSFPQQVGSGAGPRSLQELTTWAETMVDGGRLDQLSLRFSPLLEAWRKAEHSTDALALAELWARVDEESVTAWERLGELRLELKDFSGALSAFEKAITASEPPSLPSGRLSELHLGRALSAWELSDLDLAAAAFEEALASEPTPIVRFQWARFLHWRGESGLAWGVLKPLPESMRRRPEVALLSARACSGSSVGTLSGETSDACSLEEAVALFELAVGLLPDHAEAHYGLARAYRLAGFKQKASQSMLRYRALLKEDLDSTRTEGKRRK